MSNSGNCVTRLSSFLLATSTASNDPLGREIETPAVRVDLSAQIGSSTAKSELW